MSYPKPKRAAWILKSFKRFLDETEILDKLESQPHDEMIAEMEKCIPDFAGRRQHRTLYLAPRFSFKTSLAIAFVVYLVLRFPNISISIYRASQLLSKDMLGAICDILQRNPVILDVFGDVSQDAPTWTALKITVNTRTRTGAVDPTISVYGLRISMAGTHPDFVLLDDIVTDLNCDSIVEMQKAERLVESSYPVLPMWGSLLITGTQWSAIDAYWKIRQKNATLLEQGKTPDFEEYIRSVYVRDDQTGLERLFFPAMLNEAFLERQRETITGRMYAAWYYQEVRELGLAPFPKEKIRFFDGIYDHSPVPTLRVELVPDSKNYGPPIPLYVALITDPALTGSTTSDNYGVNVVGFDYLKRWWVFESQEWRELPSGAIKNTIKLLIEFQPHAWLIENQNADPEYVAGVSNFIREARLPTVILSYNALRDEAQGQRGKDQRILAMEPRFFKMLVALRRRHCTPLLRQLDNYPSLEHDDCLDSLAMGRKLESRAPKEGALSVEMDDREPPDLVDTMIDAIEKGHRKAEALLGGGRVRGGWTGPLSGTR